MISEISDPPLFFIGVGGTGMAPLAAYELLRGRDVRGSDRNSLGYSGLLTSLVDLGLRIFPQDGSGISRTHFEHGTNFRVVRTRAVEDTVTDIVATRNLEIEMVSRSSFLSEIVNSHPRAVAIAGTAGKSTVTGMIFHVLRECGMDPSYISGSPLVGAGAAAYGSGPLIVEADESDLSLLEYRPWGAVILNVHRDHHNIVKVREVFSTFIGQVRDNGFVVVNFDCPHLSEIIAPLRTGLVERGVRIAGFSRRDSLADFLASETGPSRNGWGSVFEFAGVSTGVPFPGEFQIDNALAALAVSVCCDAGISPATAAMINYPGIARRFQLRGEKRGVKVVDDFAHNPEEIRQAVKAATAISKRVIAVYQPHGFGPTRFTFDDLVDAISTHPVEKVKFYLTDIFYGGGTVEKDVSSKQIVSEAKRRNPRASILYAPSIEKLASEIAADAIEDTLVLVMGARDINRICPMILEELFRRGPKTSC